MRRNGQLIKCLIPKVVATFLSLFFLFGLNGQASAFTNQILTQGASGDDVIELQARLQYIGFYSGKIDGHFSYGTYWALRSFQQKYGLKVDGQAGTSTKQKLAKVSQFDKNFIYSNLSAGNTFTYYGGVPLNQQVKKKNKGQLSAGDGGNSRKNQNYSVNHLPQGYSQSDINLMANAVYGESRGEPYIGQVAVASVIINRVADPRFPNNISDVIFQPGAFTAVSDGQIWLTPNVTAKKAVMDAINGWDPTHGAIYYFNPETATSAWIWSRPQIGRIGKHIFCK
ncbi:spore cortex-lytic enzyme [Sporolactobacillus sp. THM7-4]|nr:spore cortex-lytic enzyme [Sporolactobacillus sp. THM7-4]